MASLDNENIHGAHGQDIFLSGGDPVVVFSTEECWGCTCGANFLPPDEQKRGREMEGEKENKKA
jgi:hypothetical protein